MGPLLLPARFEDSEDKSTKIVTASDLCFRSKESCVLFWLKIQGRHD